MAPGFMSAGATSPGITSSSPVENRATRGRRTTGRLRQAQTGGQAQSWRATGAGRAAAPPRRGVTSSPARRTHWPGAGTASMCTACKSPPTSRVSSCITTASAPSGMGAPVKMRAQVPGRRGSAACPAAMRCDTGSTTPASVTSATAHRVTVHRRVVLRRHLQARTPDRRRAHGRRPRKWPPTRCPQAAARDPSRRCSASSSDIRGARAGAVGRQRAWLIAVVPASGVGLGSYSKRPSLSISHWATASGWFKSSTGREVASGN